MIDYLEQQQQQQATPEFWLQRQQSRGPVAQPNLALMSNNGQVIRQQAALHHNNHHRHHNQPQPAYQKHVVDLLQPSEVQQINGASNNELIGYYFGSISRETAEWILKNHGNHLDGAYLLRSSGPKDDFVLSLMVAHEPNNDINHKQVAPPNNLGTRQALHLEVLHYRIVETDDSFVALHGQVGDEKFATIDELIEKAQGVATKPKWPIQRQSLESQILPPTFWGLTVDQVRLAILIKAKQWGFPLSIFQQPIAAYQVDSCLQQKQQQPYMMNNSNSQLNSIQSNESLNGDSVSQVNLNSGVTTLNNETIRTLIYKSLHEFQPWFHGKISREEAERRIENGQPRDGRFLVRERDNTSYAMCISHKRTTKHYRIDVLPTGELAIQDGRKFTSLMALISHYTIMSDGLWCALTEPCPRPIHAAAAAAAAASAANNNNTAQNNLQTLHANARFSNQFQQISSNNNNNNNNNIYCVPPPSLNGTSGQDGFGPMAAHRVLAAAAAAPPPPPPVDNTISSVHSSTLSSHIGRHTSNQSAKQSAGALMCPAQSTAAVLSIKAPIKELLHTINHKWSQSALNSFLFGASNPLNNHCHHHRNHNSHNQHHHHHHHHARDHNHRRRTCTKSGCSRHGPSQATHQHERDKSAHKTPSASNNSSHRPLLTSRPSCDCCYETSNSLASYSRQDGVQTMIQNRMQQPAGGGGAGCGSIKSTNLPPTASTNNLILQYIGSQHVNGNNGSADQLVTDCSGGGGAPPVGATQGGGGGGADYTKALLSCLPQNSGFMLDSQSFIGSPLFAVKTHSTPSAASAAAGATIDGFASRNGNGGNRACSLNGMGGSRRSAAGSSASGSGCANDGGGGGGGNTVTEQEREEKLISPAQSVSANLNNHQTAATATNPYALNTSDIYGSQTSTAVVNDHLLTGSSSSPSAGNSSQSNNNGQQRQQSSVDLKQHRAPPNQMAPNTHRLQSQSINSFGQAAARYSTQNAISHSIVGTQAQLVSGSGGQSKTTTTTTTTATSQPRLVDIPPASSHTNHQHHQHNYQGAVSIGGGQLVAQMGVAPVQHAGPIFCGQHAGPAYRYTNCTGDQGLARSCYHSRALGGGGATGGNGQLRAFDDSQLMMPSSQLGGPAALTKFVQFQDGQCLRTHRDTRSIQAAYLLSRQEALNVLNSRNSSTMIRPGQGGRPAHGYNPPTSNGHHSTTTYNNRNDGQFTSSATRFANAQQQPQLARNGPPVQTSQNNSAQAQQQQADFDLIDCDGSGFQFKYDPKLIKSSSIETLCGGNDDDDDDADDCLEDLSNFKTNSELLMSLKSCWPNFTAPATTNGAALQPFDILSPIIPSSTTMAEPPLSNSDEHHNHQESSVRGEFDLSSPMNDTGGCTNLAASNPHTGGGCGGCVGGAGDLDESFRRKHDLDDLTTSLLAELTASLKAQVDLKNKRLGLSVGGHLPPPPPPSGAGGQEDGAAAQQRRRDEQPNPRELINEFDTLVATTNR